MKHKLMLCSMLLILSCGGLVTAKDARYQNLMRVADWSHSLPAAAAPTSVNKLHFQNILDTSRWSKLMVGKVLTATLRKRAHGLQQDEFGGDELFAIGHGSGGCGWSCCFKTCMNSAMSGTGNMCLSSCTACGLTGSAWACAICVGCGAVGFASIEFCGLHCCVFPGC